MHSPMNVHFFEGLNERDRENSCNWFPPAIEIDA